MTPQKLSTLHERAFPGSRAWSAQEFTSLMAQNGSLMVSNAHAFVLLRCVADEAEVITLATDPGQRRQGHARAVLTGAEDKARQQGIAEVFLEVAADNQAAIRLYESLSYRQIGQRKAYYQRPEGPSVDALMFRKTL